MEKKKYNKFYIFTLIVVSSFLLVACGSGGGDSDDSGKTQIEFWSFWGGGARRDTIEEIIDDFNESQDDIEFEHVYQPWGDIWTKALAAVTAGNPPDVIVQDINTVRQRAGAQQATNIQEYIDNENEDEDMEEKFYPQLWDSVVYDDEAYGLPFNTDTYVLFYNKDLFEEAGLDPDSPPSSWDKLEEMSEKLEVKDGNDWERFGFYPLWNIDTNIWALNADEGTSWFDDEENVKINTDNKIEALDWILDWQEYYSRDTINKHESEFGSGVEDPFISELVAMRGQNINYYLDLKENAPEDFNFGVAPLPEHKDGSGHYTWGGGFALEIPYGAENPEASYEFMEYLTSEEVQEKFGLASFDIMANQEANQALVENDELEEQGQMIFKLADENFENTVLTPAPLSAPDFGELINGQIDEALLGKKSAKEALDDAQKSVEKLADQNE